MPSIIAASPPMPAVDRETLRDRPSTNATDSMPRFSSLSQSQNHPEIHSCRWSWCRLTFDTNAGLEHHVIHDHVLTAVPVRRDDIAIYRRVEEGIGESLTLSGLGMSTSSHVIASGSKPRTIEENTVELELTSSLPSPPASSPTSATFEDVGQYPYDYASAFAPEAPLRNPFPPSHLNDIVHEDSTTPKRRQTPPSFASLSSPLDYQFDMLADPPMPTFDSLVESAIGANRRRTEDSPAKPSPSSQPGCGGTQGSQVSSTSSSSYDSVEKQLTQSMDVDDDIDLNSEPMFQPAFHSTALGAVNDTTPLRGTPVRAKQAWYGTWSARSLTSPLVDASVRNALPTASQLSNKETQAETHSGHIFHSGMLRITPAASPSMDDGGRSRQWQADPSTQSQSQSQGSSLEYVSYPPLQTQAPYRSQSLSQ
ncbi:hypothetical protein FPV67DRAFT_1471953 [Lyophyllum atratum]|nr:hypothetical protein FPV67DRAFT_1471953 [Lyophyllum atratum]